MHWGAGYDRHGQDATAAAVQAVQRATETVTMPGVVNFVPDGFDGLKVKVSLSLLSEPSRCKVHFSGHPVVWYDCRSRLVCQRTSQWTMLQ